MYQFIKRGFDIFVCVVILPFWVILFLFVGIAIKIEDHGKIFYKSARIGKDSKKFYMLKFRSMVENAENILNADGSTYNSKTDKRVTRIGRILRETSIDETPQIFNVLKGEMSIIGPRASGWEALPTYKEDELDKMKVRPGVTGYTQDFYRNSLSVREKRLYDSWYANNASLFLDCKILLKTIVTVLMHENIYTN